MHDAPALDGDNSADQSPVSTLQSPRSRSTRRKASARDPHQPVHALCHCHQRVCTWFAAATAAARPLRARHAEQRSNAVLVPLGETQFLTRLHERRFELRIACFTHRAGCVAHRGGAVSSRFPARSARRDPRSARVNFGVVGSVSIAAARIARENPARRECQRVCRSARARTFRSLIDSRTRHWCLLATL